MDTSFNTSIDEIKNNTNYVFTTFDFLESFSYPLK